MSKLTFKGKNTDLYSVFPLTKDFSKKNVTIISTLLTDIVGASSNEEFIVENEYKNRYFHNKWDLSFVCVDSEGCIVAIVIAYFRFSDKNIPFDSIYIHRISVKKEQRLNYIAFNLMELALTGYFTKLDWLNNVTIQVTTLPKNIEACKLYKKLGFRNFGILNYSSKTDAILILERYNWNKMPSKVAYNQKYFVNPRFKHDIKKPVTFYISSGSKEKRTQLSTILSHYNLKSGFYSPPVELIEPQVDSVDQSSEELLVSHPLKNIARFVKYDKVPFLVEDTMLFIERFNKNYDEVKELPGLDTKRWWRQLGNKGVLELLGKTKKRKAKYVSQVGCYIGDGVYFYGRGELEGVISTEERETQEAIDSFPRTNSLFFHKIFIPDGFDQTLGELNEQDFTLCDYRKKSIEDLLEKMNFNNIDIPMQYPLFLGEDLD